MATIACSMPASVYLRVARKRKFSTLSLRSAVENGSLWKKFQPRTTLTGVKIGQNATIPQHTLIGLQLSRAPTPLPSKLTQVCCSSEGSAIHETGS